MNLEGRIELFLRIRKIPTGKFLRFAEKVWLIQHPFVSPVYEIAVAFLGDGNAL